MTGYIDFQSVVAIETGTQLDLELKGIYNP